MKRKERNKVLMGIFSLLCIMSLFSLIGLDEEQQTMSVFLEGETGSR